MLAIGFVPNRVNVDAHFARIQDSLELGPTLVGESVAGAEGVFFDFHDLIREKMGRGPGVEFSLPSPGIR
jgi:hypothetical protein